MNFADPTYFVVTWRRGGWLYVLDFVGGEDALVKTARIAEDLAEQGREAVTVHEKRGPVEQESAAAAKERVWKAIAAEIGGGA